ncbi:hypothetical protein [Marinobacter sp. CHS3-4]|uniref:hypothetical protein n=1 Tax=Marinobacter sp. CHS3-4 TaxID=3045174 RepID=UPI0024B5E7D2|nr:hypothetical protein [Marinobacter sp. CHS3-4]MDI9245430.1 hypothetical protein [Marinobacter sp. CHS3-4]
MNISSKLLLSCALSLSASLVSAENHQALIDQARSAAPSMVSSKATIMYQGKVLSEGTNGWVCMPETMPGDNSPICNDATWMEMLHAVGTKGPFEAREMGLSYMLGGDGGVSNSDPYHADHANSGDFIKEGPHLMLIVPKAMLKGITDNPHAGGPYVMWKDTPYAHIMIPVGERD